MCIFLRKLWSVPRDPMNPIEAARSNFYDHGVAPNGFPRMIESVEWSSNWPHKDETCFIKLIHRNLTPGSIRISAYGDNTLKDKKGSLHGGRRDHGGWVNYSNGWLWVRGYYKGEDFNILYQHDKVHNIPLRVEGTCAGCGSTNIESGCIIDGVYLNRDSVEVVTLDHSATTRCKDCFRVPATGS